MMLPRRPTNTRKRAQFAICVALLLVGTFSMGVTQAHVTAVTGHSVFYNGDGYDQCLASIAGILRLRVMWFNDQTLVESYDGKGNYVYAVEHGAPDPRDEALISVGTTYDFVDPNGVRWVVQEAYWEDKYARDTGVNTGDGVDPDNPASAGGVVEGHNLRYYTWIVAVGDSVKDTYHGEDGSYPVVYNFVNLVNTCKMHRETAFAGETTHDPANETEHRDFHPPNEDRKHEHEQFQVDLWVGRAPDLTEVCYEDAGVVCDAPPNEYSQTASWAQQWGENPGGADQDDNQNPNG